MPRPPVFLLVALFAAGCTKFDALNATVPHLGYAKSADMPYGQLPRQRLDVYRPCSVPQDGHERVVIFFYGGYWREGSKSDYFFAAQGLVSKGFVTVMPDYRVWPDVRFPAFVYDGAQVIRWTRDHIAEFGGDPSRIYIMGHSAGAHIAALLALDEGYLKSVGLDHTILRGVACLSGPYDFVPDPTSRALFGMTEGQQKADPKTQPITFADGHNPPMLLIHGQTDDVVHADNARKLYDKIRAHGGDVHLKLYPNRGHPSIVMALAFPFRWLAPTLRDCAKFFRAH
jgi:acetyl esterase/lipase